MEADSDLDERLRQIMPKCLQITLCVAVLFLVAAFHAPRVAGHAAFVRSDPAAGATLPSAPQTIRIWFAEPLEPSYTRGALLDAAGQDVPGVSSAVDSQDAHLLVLTLPAQLPDGGYTVSWRNLSVADGHSLQGYFGFRVGEGGPSASAVVASSMSGNDALRAISRWLAILGLAALIAIAPTMLLVIDPTTRMAPALQTSLPRWLRRFVAIAIVLAFLGSVMALATQAATIAPDASLLTAIGGTLSDTRYGQLWFARIGLLAVCALAVGMAIWGRPERRQAALIVATLVGIAAPLPFSLLSHAAAQDEGRTAAVTADALHLLSAALWAGGLLMLVCVCVPAVWRLSAEAREITLRTAIPRFSVLGLAAWGVLLLSGLYASWLQVGTFEALRDTDYGRTLLIKGLVILPTLALAAYHYRLGWRGAIEGGGQTARTLTAEALLAVAVLLVVGRLVGLEPAREVVASLSPTALTIPLSFDTNEGPRPGTLAISPGAAGPNTFTLRLDGAPLPEGSEGVLRFSLPSQSIGEEELRLPESGTNQFRVDGSELALAGRWQIDVIARKIGSYSWNTRTEVAVGAVPPAAPQPNPAPLFDAVGALGMVIIALGLCALAAGIALRARSGRWRMAGVVAGLVSCLAGGLVLVGSRLAPVTAEQAALAVEQTALVGTPEGAPEMGEQHDHGTPAPLATPEFLAQAAAAGTPVSQHGLTATLELTTTAPGPAEIAIALVDDTGKPVTGAQVTLVNEMTGMGKDETAATEAAPGRYVAKEVPLSMSGEWRLLARVSPKGAATQIFTFRVEVP